MKLRNFFCFLLCLILIIGSAGCAGTNTHDTDTETEPEASIMLPPSRRSDNDGADEKDDADTPAETRVMIEHKLAAFTDSKNGCVGVLDLGAEDPTADSAVLWTWSATARSDVENAQFASLYYDDIKLRRCDAWGGDVVGITSSTGLIALVSYPSGDCLFNTHARGYGPHSIEILPNGLVAVACSGNGVLSNSELRLYTAMSKNDDTHIAVDLPSAHGVSWDPENDVLWALGDTELCAYTVGGTRTQPTLTKRGDMGIDIPGGGHDLSPVYGNPDRMWISCSSGVLMFLKSKKILRSSFEGSTYLSARNTKSINSYTDGTAIATVGDTPNVLKYFSYVPNGSTKWRKVTKDYVFPNRTFYKVRTFVPEYQ